jgi:5,10-methylenetetrahydromethanopterin reductase
VTSSPGFDLGFIPSGSVSETLGLVALGEELGYRCAWIPDQGFHRDPFALLSLAAQACKRIDVGVGITSPFTRLPVQIARGAATVDEIAGGRMRLGLGTGNVAQVVRPLGVHYTEPVVRTRDAIRIIRQLLAGEAITVDTKHDHLDGVGLEFDARPDIPIYVGTRGPRMLEMSGAEADGVLVESLFNSLPGVTKRLEAGAAAAGRALSDIDVVSWQLVIVTDQPGPVIHAHKPWIARSIQIGPAEVVRDVGIPEDVIRDVTAAMQRGDTDAAIAAVTDEAVQCLMLIGTPEEIRQRFTQIFKDGADTVGLVGVGSYDAFADTLRLCASEVMPEFRK